MSDTAASRGLLDARCWARRLAAEAGLFASLAEHSRIGVVAETIVAGATRSATQMIVWEKSDRAMRAGVEPYPGFETAAVDLLIAADETAERALGAALCEAWLPALRALIRDGHVLCFARRPRAALEDGGYEELLYELGFAYLGACR
jgi:hypothetical protein